MKKLWRLLLVAVICLFLTLFLLSGGEISPVGLARYSVAEDGRSVTLSVGVVASTGYTRTVKTRAEGDSLYLTFYSTFGFNSSWGARNTFTVDLPEGCRNIYFMTGSNPFLALTLSSESGQWEDPNHPPSKRQ